VPASTTKLLTEGTVLARLGANFRFHTKVFRTGPVDSGGRLKGDLVLVAAGDPNLSNRIQPDGTLAFMDDDHSEGGPLLAGDPLAVIKELVEAVRAKGMRAAGVTIAPERSDVQSDRGALAHVYSQENLVAEHVSPVLSQDLKVTLKVSQNLHAGIGQYLLGAYVGHDAKDTFQAGFQIEHAFLEAAQLDLSGASQGDGAGGDWADLFSPDFICSYLTYWSGRPDFDALLRALPVLGKDGTLAKIQTQSPAAGHVFAKTGTLYFSDRLNNRNMLNSKGLAGYVWTLSGRKLAFAAYVNHVAIADSDGAQMAGQALGAIAAAAYDAPPFDDGFGGRGASFQHRATGRPDSGAVALDASRAWRQRTPHRRRSGLESFFSRVVIVSAAAGVPENQPWPRPPSVGCRA
jgi:D-alanyl-D-alanine carboxypeptidase